VQFLVDDPTGVAVATYLRSVGHDVLAVAETMPQADDSDILARAAAEDRILLTNDRDFGELVFRNGQAHSAIVLLRLQDESATNRVRVVEDLLDRFADRLAGHFAVATETGVRFRPLTEPL